MWPVNVLCLTDIKGFANRSQATVASIDQFSCKTRVGTGSSSGIGAVAETVAAIAGTAAEPVAAIAGTAAETPEPLAAIAGTSAEPVAARAASATGGTICPVAKNSDACVGADFSINRSVCHKLKYQNRILYGFYGML
jgi:hypothetical protein